VYANKRARQILDIGVMGIPVRASGAAAAIAAEVRAAAQPCRDLEIASAEGKALRGEAWPMFGGAIAFAVREAVIRNRSEVLQATLGIGRRDAQLALDVTDGQSNKAIAEMLNVPLGTVATRLSRLYRRIGVQNRAELAALVTSRLDAAARA
jgi:DNA-binding NarL/FixJ family response regulator